MTQRTKTTCGLFIIVLIVIVTILPVLADRNTPVTMDFRGADLRDVFRSLAQIAEVNLITHQSVQGEITLNLRDVPFNQAIELITLINDLDYKWVGNTLLIAEPTEIQDNFSKTTIETFKIQYAQLDKIKEIMEALLVGSTITIDERTRMLVVAGETSDLQKIDEIIHRLDQPVAQVFLEVQVEEVSTTGLDKLGAGDNSARLKFITDEDRFIVDMALELPEFVEYLKQEGLARTLANPGLVTLDGQVSKILIGDKIPVTTEEEVDGKIKTTIKYIDAGIQLEFTPRITDDGFITLDVKPQISSLGEYLTQGYPLIKSREVETVVRIRDGETFVIGGLIRDEDRTSLEKVPFLGDIPILGALFKHEEGSKQSSEIIIFITPRIIYPDDKQPSLFTSSQVSKQLWEAMQIQGAESELEPAGQAAENSTQTTGDGFENKDSNSGDSTDNSETEEPNQQSDLENNTPYLQIDQ